MINIKKAHKRIAFTMATMLIMGAMPMQVVAQDSTNELLGYRAQLEYSLENDSLTELEIVVLQFMMDSIVVEDILEDIDKWLSVFDIIIEIYEYVVEHDRLPAITPETSPEKEEIIRELEDILNPDEDSGDGSDQDADPELDPELDADGDITFDDARGMVANIIHQMATATNLTPNMEAALFEAIGAVNAAIRAGSLSDLTDAITALELAAAEADIDPEEEFAGGATFTGTNSEMMAQFFTASGTPNPTPAMANMILEVVAGIRDSETFQ